jgi:hypothetical protein
MKFANRIVDRPLAHAMSNFANVGCMNDCGDPGERCGDPQDGTP